MSTVSTLSTLSTVSTVIARCYLHLRWYFCLSHCLIIYFFSRNLINFVFLEKEDQQTTPLEVVFARAHPTYSCMGLNFEQALTWSALQVLVKIEVQAQMKHSLPLQIPKHVLQKYLAWHNIVLSEKDLNSILTSIQFNFPTWVDIGKLYIKIYSLEIISRFQIKNTFSALWLKSPYTEKPHLHVFSQFFQDVVYQKKISILKEYHCSCHFIEDYLEKEKNQTWLEDLRKRQRMIFLENKNTEDFEIRLHPLKGRAVHSKRFYSRGQPIVEYKGSLISQNQANSNHELITNGASYIMWFPYNNQKLALDATQETGDHGRLVNHCRGGRGENCVPQIYHHEGVPRVLLVAKRLIKPGEELCYDYGERSPEVVLLNPWLKRQDIRTDIEDSTCSCDYERENAHLRSTWRDIYCQDKAILPLEALHQYTYWRQVQHLAELESHKYYRTVRKHKTTIDRRRPLHGIKKKRQCYRRPFKQFFYEYHKQSADDAAKRANKIDCENLFMCGQNLFISEECTQESICSKFFNLKTHNKTAYRKRVFSSLRPKDPSSLRSHFFSVKNPFTENL